MHGLEMHLMFFYNEFFTSLLRGHFLKSRGWPLNRGRTVVDDQ